MEPNNNEEKILTKFNEIQEEIIRIGWNGILELYHPDININQKNAFRVFNLYKEIYVSMKKRLTISE